MRDRCPRRIAGGTICTDVVAGQGSDNLSLVFWHTVTFHGILLEEGTGRERDRRTVKTEVEKREKRKKRRKREKKERRKKSVRKKCFLEERSWWEVLPSRKIFSSF